MFYFALFFYIELQTLPQRHSKTTIATITIHLSPFNSSPILYKYSFKLNFNSFLILNKNLRQLFLLLYNWSVLQLYYYLSLLIKFFHPLKEIHKKLYHEFLVNRIQI